MDIETALELADALVFAQTEKHLDDLQTAIFRGSWQGNSFTDIAESCNCDDSHAKEVGSKLWKLLSSALGEQVGKKSLKAALERRWKAQQSGKVLTFENSVAAQVQPDPNFVGRENAIADLNTLISQGNKVILIQAEGGVGKTTLAGRYLTTQRFDIVLELPMAKERKNITSVESVIEEWLKRDFDEEPGREFGITLQRLRYQLRDGSKKIGILIDNLEPALLNGRFVEEHRRYVELFRVLTDPDVQSITLITSREPIHENGICLWLYQLKELPQEAWHQFFEIRSINTNFSPLDNASALCQMHQAYGGNAEAMFVLGGAIQNECQGDLEAYWQENRDNLLINPTLENLIKNQFDNSNKMTNQLIDFYVD